MEDDVIDMLFRIWTPSYYGLMATTDKEFSEYIKIQLDEVQEAIDTGDKRHSLLEMADIISLTNNWMRAKGLTAEGVRNVIKHRALTRYLGRTESIINKYHNLPNKTKVK